MSKNLTKEQLVQDIIKCSKAADVKYDENLVNDIVSTYEDQFIHPLTPVCMRTTTKEKKHRGVNVRYADFWTEHNPYAMALEKGYIKKEGHPIDDTFSEIISNYPVGGQGIDFGVTTGLEKIWPFFAPTELVNVDRILSMKSMPDSMKQSIKLFEKYKLDNFALFALDYYNKSVNVYFMSGAVGGFSKEQIIGILKDLDFAIPEEEIIERCTRGVTLYFTYNWDSPNIERVCYGICADSRKDLPIHLSPVIRDFSAGVPTISLPHHFIYSITFARTGNYIKVENDYYGMVDWISSGGQPQS